MARPQSSAAAAQVGAGAGAPAADSLQRYRTKRDFAKTSEPAGVRIESSHELAFVIQKHAATRLHYDFRLELDGVMLSWAVPKGPSYDPADKRMAVRTEDHPLSYAAFEGTIPPGQYGAGTVIVWDRGTWVPLGDPRTGLANGKLAFELHGQKLSGTWEMVRIKKPGQERQEPWLLFKKRDHHARPHTEYDVVNALPDSVIAKPLAAAGGSALHSAPRQVEVPVSAPPAAQAIRPRSAQAKKSKSIRLGHAEAAALPDAVEAPMPQTLVPQLATLADRVPARGDWIYEIKFDGYRLLARVDSGQVHLVTRSGHDWTAKMPQLVSALEALEFETAWLDGEIVVLGASNAPDFNALQNAFDTSSTDQITYFLFDLPYYAGHDLRQAPLHARRALLQRLLETSQSEQLRFSADFPADPASLLESARRLNLEGVIAKRADAPYRSGRSATWLKLKCHLRQEFVVGGFTDRAGATSEIGSLILGVHDDAGVLVSVGSVGTGWNGETARDLATKLARIESPTSPFEPRSGASKGRWSRRAAGSERWVEPQFVVEVSFGSWTPDGQLRHATYIGMRTDKPATAVRRETAVDASTAAAAAPADAKTLTAAKRKTSKASAPPPEIKVSNPERVIDPSTGLTKLDLVRYYESVADWILPHLRGRPVSLVRGPSGVDGTLFFQKHGEKIGIPGIVEMDPALWPGHEPLLEVTTAQALRGAAQMNVIEFHTWNSVARHIDKPDRMVFDLDPGEGVAWGAVQEGAELVRALLQQLGLESWLKTSGGKGLHLVVPLAPRWDFDTVKDFSQAAVQHLARTIPARFVAKSGPWNRLGKIFVDYLRNGHGATTAAAFSARARPGLGVSMPVAWADLGGLKGGAQWTIRTAREYLTFQKDDPWAGAGKLRQSLVGPMKALGFEPARRPPAKAT